MSAMTITILLLTVALMILAGIIARRWYIAYRDEKRLRVDELLRRGFREAHRRGWVRVDAAPLPDERSSIDRFRRESGSR